MKSLCDTSPYSLGATTDELRLEPTMAKSASSPADRWKMLSDIEEGIKHYRNLQDDAKAGIDNHRKRHEAIQGEMTQLPADQQDQARKKLKVEIDAWSQAEKAYEDAVKELSALETKKRKLMADMDKEMSQEDDVSNWFKKLSGTREKTKQEGKEEAEAMVDLVQTIMDASSKRGPAATTAPRTKSLANLPLLAKPGNFMEHLTKLETYFRINEVTKSSDKKDILMLSLSAEVANRAQGIDANLAPFDGQNWREFAESVRGRMIPKASAAILRSQFESLKQSPAEYAIDYLVKKNALFLKAFPGDAGGERAMPVSYLVRHLVDGLHHEDLKAEIWREIRGDLDENDERDMNSVNAAFDTLLQATNLTLDFVRRNLQIKDDVDKRGLSIVSKPYAETRAENVKTNYASSASWVNQMEIVDEEEWIEQEEEEDPESPLTEEVISYCELVEDEDQSHFWNSEEINETNGGTSASAGEGGGRRACWTCGSLMHYKRQCPQRLKAVTTRVNALIQGPGRSRARGGRRGWSRSGRPASSARGRGGGGLSGGFSAYAPFGRSSDGRGRFYPSGQQPTWYPSAPQGASRNWTNREQHPF